MATPRTIFIAAALVAAVFLAPAMSQAHVAASIAYEETPRPQGLPDDLQPLPDVSLRFLSINAIDGFKIVAALWQPRAKPAASTTLLVQVHGSGGNLASVQLRATARTLSAQGFAALSISTKTARRARQHGQFFRDQARHRGRNRGRQGARLRHHSPTRPQPRDCAG